MLIIALTFVLGVGCNKYDDGPMVSFRSVEERVTNNWRVEKAIENGNDVSGDFDKYDISFREDKTVVVVAHYSFIGIEYDYTANGTWSLQDNNEKIVIDYEDGTSDASYFILKLKEKELNVREEGSNLELHLVPM